MKIQDPQAYRINQLPGQTREKFESFLSAPRIWEQEINYLHTLDWQKFYKFIRHCHRHRVKISSTNVKELLIEAKFSRRFAKHLAEIFDHGIALLRHK